MTFPIHRMSSKALAQLVTISAGCVLLGALVMLCKIDSLIAVPTAGFLLALTSLFVWLTVGMSRASASLDGRRLVLSLPLYGRGIDLERIEPESLMTIDLAGTTPYTPTWRTNGLSVTSLNLGWFRTSGAGTTLMATTSRSAVALRTKDGFAVVLSVLDPDAFVQATKAALAQET